MKIPSPDLLKKLNNLKKSVRELKSALVALSGGVDSTFLLWVTKEELGDRVCAVTVFSPLSPDRELKEAQEIAHALGARFRLLSLDPLLWSEFRENSPERCYYCKKLLYNRLLELAQAEGYAWVVDGANKDDEDDYRPGSRARHELGVRSPLQEAGLSKQEIRLLSQEAGLSTWNKPAAACLASRISYGEEITREKLQMIDQAEEFLRSLGCRLVRVRLHRQLARIEVDPGEFSLILRHRGELAHLLKKIGFLYVTLDLAGYRTGSMNKMINV